MAKGELSSGRAAELLGQQRGDFIRYAAAKGIPYFQMTGEEVRREVDKDKLRTVDERGLLRLSHTRRRIAGRNSTGCDKLVTGRSGRGICSQ